MLVEDSQEQIYTRTIRNPITQNDVTVRYALSLPDEHPAHKAAEALLDKHGVEPEEEEPKQQSPQTGGSLASQQTQGIVRGKLLAFDVEHAEEHGRKHLNGTSPVDIAASYLEMLGVTSEDQVSTIEMTVRVIPPSWPLGPRGDAEVQGRKLLRIAIKLTDGTEITRSFETNLRTGETVIHNDVFVLGDNVPTGTGNGKRMLRTTLQIADRIGAKKVEVTAGLSSGGYVWAKYGAVLSEFNRHTTYKLILTRLTERTFFTSKIKSSSEALERDRQTLAKAIEKGDVDEIEHYQQVVARIEKRLSTVMEQQRLLEENPEVVKAIIELIRAELAKVANIEDESERGKLLSPTLLAYIASTPIGKILLGIAWSGYFDMEKGSVGRNQLEHSVLTESVVKKPLLTEFLSKVMVLGKKQPNMLLVEFLGSILESDRFKAVKKGVPGDPNKPDRIVYFRSKESKDLKISKGTHREYDQEKDSHLDKKATTSNTPRNPADAVQGSGRDFIGTQGRGIIPPRLTQTGNDTISDLLQTRIDMLVHARMDKNRQVEFDEYRQKVNQLITVINGGDVGAIKKSLEELGIKSYADLLSSPLFKRPPGLGEKLVNAFKEHLPGLLEGDPETAIVDADTLSRINPTVMFPSSSFTVVTSGESPPLNTALQTFEFDEAAVRAELIRRGIEPDIIEEMIPKIRARVLLHNAQAEIIKEEVSETGLVQLKSGQAGMEQLRDQLSDALFPNNPGFRKVFNDHVSALTDPNKSVEARQEAWKVFHKFLLSQFSGQGNVIPTICEYIKAMQVLATEPEAVVYLPRRGNFPVGDVIIVRSPVDKQVAGRRPRRRAAAKRRSFIELADTQYIELGSVKRERGAPSSYTLQMKLTVMSDDPIMDDPTKPRNGSQPRSREVLQNLVDGTKFTLEDLSDLERQFGISAPGESESGTDDRLQKITRCICKGKKGKQLRTCRTDGAQKLAQIYQRKERLFRLLYNKMVLEQGYTNTTYTANGITTTDGKQKKAVIKPDFRFVCEKNQGHHVAREGGTKPIRAYITYDVQ